MAEMAESSAHAIPRATDTGDRRMHGPVEKILFCWRRQGDASLSRACTPYTCRALMSSLCAWLSLARASSIHAMIVLRREA